MLSYLDNTNDHESLIFNIICQIIASISHILNFFAISNLYVIIEFDSLK